MFGGLGSEGAGLNIASVDKKPPPPASIGNAQSVLVRRYMPS